MALYVWMYLTFVVGFLFVRSVIYQSKVKRYEREIALMMDRRKINMKEEFYKIKKDLSEIDDAYKKYTIL